MQIDFKLSNIQDLLIFKNNLKLKNDLTNIKCHNRKFILNDFPNCFFTCNHNFTNFIIRQTISNKAILNASNLLKNLEI